jgi:heat shock protein HslJ
MNKTIFLLSIFLITVLLTACTASQSGGGELTGQMWVMTQLGGKAPVANTGISAQFNSDGTVSGSAGCNRYTGQYTTTGNSITISNVASTMMACEQPVMDQESAYLKALSEAKTYTAKDKSLTLFGADGKPLVTYEAQSQELAGTNWEVTGYNNGKMAVVSVLLDTTITAEFGKDGTLSGTSGCNQYSGPYTVTGNQIQIGPWVSTMTACDAPEGIMDQESQYLAAIQSAATYLMEGSVLELRTADGALAATFTKK